MNDTRYPTAFGTGALLMISLVLSACTFGMPELRNPLDPQVSVSLDEITFADSDFRDIVYSSVNGPFETNYVYWIETEASAVTSIEGAQYLSNLETLTLWNSGISTVEPLRQLRRLRELRLDDSNVSDLSPLIPVQSLRDLSLNGVDINDLTPLASLANLESLSISGNLYGGPGFTGSVQDILDATQLRNLYLNAFDFGGTESITVFVGESNLREIGIDDCNLTDFPTTNTFLNLEGLSVGGNSTLTTFPATPVTFPNLINLQLRNLSGLPATEWQTHFVNIVAPNLQHLGIGDNGLTGIPTLSVFQNLVSFNASNNAISDISALSGRSSIVDLYLENNPITDFAPVETLSSLCDAYMRNTGLSSSDLGVFAGLTNLESLLIQQNPGITNLASLSGVTPHYLHMADTTGISTLNLSHVAHIHHVIAHAESEPPSISALDVLSDPVPGATLTVLEINGQLISDISPLAAIRSLEEIYITNCNVSTGLVDLIALPNLRVLDLRGHSLPQVDIDKFLDARPEVYFY